MAESETSICNKALMALGANTIISLEDKTYEARLCKEHYAAARDAVLEDVEWSFAMQTWKLGSPVTDTADGSSFATVTLYDWAFAYRIPANMLRVCEVNKNRIDWCIEGKNILTDAKPILVRGVMRVTDPSFFTGRFVQCLFYMLAANLALPITESPTRANDMMARYAYEKKQSTGNDGRQGRNNRRYRMVRR